MYFSSLHVIAYMQFLEQLHKPAHFAQRQLNYISEAFVKQNSIPEPSFGSCDLVFIASQRLPSKLWFHTLPGPGTDPL